MGVEVKSIYVYPIKSCGGISVAEAPICSTGFRWDRQWVVNSKGRAYTQRVEPKLALVQTQLPHEAFSLNYQPNNHSFLEIKAPGMQVLKVPLVKSSSSAENVVDGISVWEWNGSAFDEGPAAAQWFSNCLGSPARLVRFNHVSGVRKVEADYAPGYNVMFADMYPFLLLSQGSMDALNARLKESVPVNRFRPNIVVDGCEAFSEDGWREMKINNATFKGVKLCSRCKIPTINQETGKAASSEPTDTLRAFRSDKALRPNNNNSSNNKGGKVYFGQNMVCTDSLATKPGNGKTVKVGDALNVLQITASPAA